MSSGRTPGCRIPSAPNRADRGFTLMEACIVVAIVIIMTAVAIPLVQSTLAFYDLQSAVSAVNGTIQTTRYRAISDGYPYKVTFDKTKNSYQIANCPGWVPATGNSCTTYSNVGGETEFASPSVQLGAKVALEFYPSGTVAITTGSSPITLSRDLGNNKTKTKSLTVSNYGSVKVE